MATFSPQSLQELKDHDGQDIFTSPSASDPEDEYVVDRIIAQSVPDTSDNEEEEMYLVRWEGYPDEQCTVSVLFDQLYCFRFSGEIFIHAASKELWLFHLLFRTRNPEIQKPRNLD
jgi:hypothetical protein